jgi:UPF0755 protein
VRRPASEYGPDQEHAPDQGRRPDQEHRPEPTNGEVAAGAHSPVEEGGDGDWLAEIVGAPGAEGSEAEVAPDQQLYEYYPEDDDRYDQPTGLDDNGLHEDQYDEVDDGLYDGAYEPAYDDAEQTEAEPFYGPAHAGPGRRSAGASQTRRKRRRRLAAIGGVIVAALVVIGIVGFINVSHDIHPTGQAGHVVSVSIPNGASTSKIGDLLAKDGVIHGPLVFELYLKLEGAGPLMPGTYHLATNQPYASVVSTLEKGPPPVIDKLVVPEGFTVRQIAAAVGRLPGVGISSHDFIEAATSGQVRSPYEPAGTNNLEGFLFPATYPVQKGETADDLVQYMVDTFDHYASQLDLTKKAALLHYNPYQVLKVASIVEREAKFETDRGLIASAIYNRLAAGTPIGAESTLLYALGDPKGPVNMETRSPYNSLLNKGLPPTPISNPGIPSLQAAMSPPKTSYIFWVEVNPDGKMGYASDEAGFAQLQVECKKAHLC